MIADQARSRIAPWTSDRRGHTAMTAHMGSKQQDLGETLAHNEIPRGLLGAVRQVSMTKPAARERLRSGIREWRRSG